MSARFHRPNPGPAGRGAGLWPRLAGRPPATIVSLALVLALGRLAGAPTPDPAGPGGNAPTPAPAFPRPVANWLEVQIALARSDFSCGLIDGVRGPKTEAALKAFQDTRGLDSTGELDDDTRTALALESEPLKRIVLTADDLGHLQPLSPTWLGKSEQSELTYETPLEVAAAHAHASEKLLRTLNSAIDWTKATVGTGVVVPDPDRPTPREAAARVEIWLSDRVLEAYNADGMVIAHFPVSIGRLAEKRPVGVLHVISIIPNPDYTFDPDIFPESEEAQSIGHKLTLPPGPKNPVGLAWIGLDRPGYGIHGTPQPANVGRTESHGCFRLTNWDALILMGLVSPNLPVDVEP
jgi:lipoprotein-anchoring transpeptidase ErfK/SrfK